MRWVFTGPCGTSASEETESNTAMTDLRPNAQDHKDVESVSDSPGPTQEPLQSHTSSLKNNAAGLSSDEHENPLNGAQSNPFVYSSVPAVPHAGNSLPSGALVNGPGSHPTSEVRCVLNKGSILSNNVLDTKWQPEKDTSPQVLPPHSELQSDAWKNTAGTVLKTVAEQSGANTPLSNSEENGSKLPYSTLSGDSSDQMHISQPLTNKAMKTRSLRDSNTELSEYSSDEYADTEVIRWDSPKKLKHISPHGHTELSKGHSKNTALATEQPIYGMAQIGCNEENDPEDEDKFSTKPENLKTERPKHDLLCFPCTICSVKFKEKGHLHRHMMYHLDSHSNQVNCENVSKPYVCRECGCLFYDNNSLMKHIIIHQERLEKVMKEIKVLKKLENEDRYSRFQCPHCVYGCNRTKSIVQHAKTHGNIKHYYCCDECSYIALNEQALEAHLQAMNDNASPKLNQKVKRQTSEEDIYDCNGNNCEATANLLDSRENPYARSYPIQKHRSSDKDKSTHADEIIEDDNNEDDDCSDIQQLVIKEEYIESAVCDDPPASPSTPKSEPFDILFVSGVEHKPCPYCPAVFESGVGLSNHVRGHLHRVGLSYNARHIVSPEQVALQDCQPHIRKRVPSGMKRLKKANKPASQEEHTCPLCRSWFDTKTGLSNHVRGHLKRIGKTISSDNKSPVCFLNELLQDKREHQNILQILNRNQSPSRPFVSQKIVSSNGSFLRHTGISMKIQYGVRKPTPVGSCVPKQEVDEFSEGKTPQVEAQGANGASSTLVELLQTMQNGTALKGRDGYYATRRHFNIAKESMEEMQVTSVESNYVHGECGTNCIHCNTNCHTSFSLSSHLRAYARRKKIAILERTSYDLKQRKPRLRPGLKRKVCPLNAVKEMYRLTCRFCDLVFQGPLSVQEDWIKHLQRHLMHTSVPHSGTGMVEVLGLQKEMNDISHEYKALEQNPSSIELPYKALAF
ncbi:zinc finger protein 644 [Lampris incognitus]|uniref:zinc finger protein 644 n=1 Tax=Lampris incognitus TaxID=2546036 RepID=UPI0024B4F551|nr:zinc finger protein 644 [Lampris incognitus]